MENKSNPQYEKMKQHVLEKIRTGEISMRPRIYFIAKIALLILLATLTLIVSALVVSFIMFSIHISGHFFLLGFGSRGIQVFLSTFPWGPLFIDILLLIGLEKVVKHFRFGYRSPFIYLVSGLVVVTLGVAYLINVTPLHNALLHRAEQRRLPVFGGMYSQLRRPPSPQHGVVRGTITEIQGNIITVQNDKSLDEATSTITIIIPNSINIHGLFTVGDPVFVAGHVENGSFEAFGIKKITTQDHLEMTN